MNPTFHPLDPPTADESDQAACILPRSRCVQDRRSTSMKFAAFPPTALPRPLGQGNSRQRHQYGLASSVWTNNVGAAARASARLDFGCVWINTHIPLVAEMPPAVHYHGFERTWRLASMELADPAKRR
jgi:Aldehyde dehydrogenase family